MADGGDGGWEVPWYAVCKLEVLGSWYYNLVQDKRLRNSQDRCCKSLPESESQRTTSVKVREPEKWMSQSERVNSPFFCLLFCSGSQGWAAAHSQWGGPFALVSVLIQMLISSRNTITDTPPNNVLSGILAFLSPVRLTHETDHHRGAWDIPTEIHLWYSLTVSAGGVHGFSCQRGLRWKQGLRRPGSYSTRTAGICVLKILSL